MSNVSEELARLAELRDRGVLSEDEFQRQKATVLGGAAPAPISADEAATKKSNAAKGCGIIAAIILVLIVIGAIAGGGDDAGSGGGAATEQLSTTPPVDVTVDELFRAYQANEAAAQQQYGDRPLMVTGVVDGVDLDFSNEPVVKLRTDNEFMSAQADLVDADQPKASGLTKGATIRLLCASVGEVAGTPMLRECRIQ